MTEQEKKEALNKKYESLKEEAKNNIQQADNTYDDGTKVFLSKEECMDKGIECHTEKQYLAREMKSIAKTCSEQTGVDKNAILKVKDYLHYKGEGWGDDCLEKSEDKVKYADKVSPTFRKLYEIFTNMYACGKESELDDYIEALATRGIRITVDEAYFQQPDKETAEIIETAINGMDGFQCSICEKNDYMNDVLAVDAENAALSPKNKYKQIIQLAVKKQDGKDVDDKIQDEYLKMELFTNGLETINEM
ncbi:MAG: hypothetical protein IKO36_06730 [Bacteroidaceae bacterium]|nr:hypothetical protein [Bacteroidaceae bacterium]